MSEKFWSVIKFKPKEGCEDEFLEACRSLKDEHVLGRECVKLDTGEFVGIACYPNLDAVLDSQIDGLTWLDEVNHLLEKYEDDSRTEAFSGFAIDLGFKTFFPAES